MLEKPQIEPLLAHRGAMFLLERVTRFDGDEIQCTACSHRDPRNPLRDGDRLPAHAAIEYAAQAAGVHGGLLSRRSRPDAPTPMAYLAVVGDVRRQVERLDDLPGDLEIRARCTAATPHGCAYRVEVAHRGRLVMSGELVIAMDGGHQRAI